MSGIDVHGYVLHRGVLDAAEVEALRETFARVPGKAHGSRRVLEVPELRVLAVSRLAGIVARVLGSGARLVRGLSFDKHGDVNWALPWHRDEQVAVREASHAASVLERIPHAPAARALLDTLLALRVHLDDTDVERGALCVVPGSHLDDAPFSEERRTIVVDARAGDVLSMRPTVLHRSSRSVHPSSRRRVLHFEYAPAWVAPDAGWFFGAAVDAA